MGTSNCREVGVATDTEKQQQANGKAGGHTKAELEALMGKLEEERDDLKRLVAQQAEERQQLVQGLTGRNATLADCVPYLVQLLQWQANVVERQGEAEAELRATLARVAGGGGG